MINLSSTVPAAPAGSQNVLWSRDASGNVSASVSGFTKTVVAPVAGVVTLNCALNNSFYVNVNAVVTSVVLTGMVDGQQVTILFAQDSTGHAVTTSSFLLGPYSITTTANKHSCYSWTYNAADNNWYQIGANNM